MLAFDLIAERRILQAIARGDFHGLPGAGSPLALDDDPLAPAETRAAHRILKNAGFVPAEVLDRARSHVWRRGCLRSIAPGASGRS